MSAVPVFGRSSPLGATIINGGVNFSLYSRTAERVELLLFDQDDDPAPSRIVPFDPALNRINRYWHTFLPGIRAGQLYGYRVYDSQVNGLSPRLNKVLLDPYGKGVVVPKNYSRIAACSDMDNSSTAMKSVVVDTSTYDWEGDAPLNLPSSRSVIYEMHVRGFTAHPNSGVVESRRGTYAGVIEKIPYLKQLGITAVELLPVFQFDAQDCPPGKVNYWGYAPVSFFAPHQAYSSQKDALGPLDEFRDMVKALHCAGIEVILDVVFNHTAEGNEHGPTICFRGIDFATYYMLADGRSTYANHSGCGNTFNTSNSVVRRLIVDSLRYWVTEMHVDGFRFDLASILARDHDGATLPNPPVLWDIESDPALAGTKLIAEAWDAAGLYQVGKFIGDSWKEWNGQFRDDVRDFFRGEPGSARRVADRMIGSPQIYAHENREAEQSINFVTCHDGFTLNDLVSYNEKHNDANGEDNRDGTNDNRSWNCGVEGPTDDSEIQMLRLRQIKNYMTVTMTSLGIPMIVMGDEVRRTQRGNNNAYCQDNELSWFDWSLVEKNADLLRFVKMLIARRVGRSITEEKRRTSLSDLIRESTLVWHGIKLNEPDWNDRSHCVALGAELPKMGLRFHFILNAYWEPLAFALPTAQKYGPWRRWIDTALHSPNDIVTWEDAPIHSNGEYMAAARSIVCLLSNQS